jgi:Ca-activated chloride channel family protein
MFAGLQAGEARLAYAPPTHPVRRVVLISDGMANIGPSSPEELGTLAAQGTESGAQVTAIGVGLDYDERTLGALAVRSSGRLYHLDAPGQMAQILQNELHLLSATVAANAYLEVVPAPRVELSGVEGLRVDRNGSAVRVPLGSLYAGQQREILLRARVDANTPGAHNLGMARLVFADPSRRDAQHHTELTLQYTVTPDAGAVASSVNERVRAIVATHDAAQAQLRAVTQLNHGNAAQAVATLDHAEAALNAAAAASNDAAQRRRLHEAAGRMRTGRASAAAAARPDAPPAASRGGAVHMNADAYHSMGF